LVLGGGLRAVSPYRRRTLEHKDKFDDEVEAGVATMGSVLVIWL
jgi:hypothetical protein